jgi:hypothetical protein
MEELRMKKCLLILVAVASLGGCAYGGVGGVGADKAVVARNDAFLFGILRKVYVCKVSDGGLTGCQSNESP